MLTLNEQNLRKWSREEWAKFVRKTNFEYPRVCAHCGGEGFIEAHHPDYKQPFKVIFLCRSCHRQVDGYNRRKRWEDCNKGTQMIVPSKHHRLIFKLGLDSVDDLVDLLFFILEKKT